MWVFYISYCLFSLTLADQVLYSGHKVLRLDVKTTQQAEVLSGIRESYDFWTEIGVGRFENFLMDINLNKTINT